MFKVVKVFLLINPVVGICAENDIVTSDGQSKDEVRGEKDDGLRPLEKKAINFLVNEYLLANDYKITSVTFAEENEDQVFHTFQRCSLQECM